MDALRNPQGPRLCSGHSSGVPKRQPGRRFTLAPMDLRELCCEVSRGASRPSAFTRLPQARVSRLHRGAPPVRLPLCQNLSGVQARGVSPCPAGCCQGRDGGAGRSRLGAWDQAAPTWAAPVPAARQHAAGGDRLESADTGRPDHSQGPTLAIGRKVTHVPLNPGGSWSLPEPQESRAWGGGVQVPKGGGQGEVRSE